MSSISVINGRPTAPNRNNRGGGRGSSGRKKGKQGGDDIPNFFQKKGKHQLTSAEEMVTKRAKRAKAEAEKKVNSATKGKATPDKKAKTDKLTAIRLLATTAKSNR